MALNEVLEYARKMSVPVAVGVVSGDPVLVGSRTGVALTDRDADGYATVDFWGAYNLSVKAIDDAGNSEVDWFTPIYYVDADTPKLSKKASGRLFGFAAVSPKSANPLIAGGATATIEIAQVDAFGPGTADITGAIIGTNQLANGAVTAPKIASGIIKTALIAGGAAGDHVVTGMVATDEILMVLEFVSAASIATATMLTSEFTAGAGKMTNVGGTDTTNNQLLVIFMHHA